MMFILDTDRIQYICIHQDKIFRNTEDSAHDIKIDVYVLPYLSHQIEHYYSYWP